MEELALLELMDLRVRACQGLQERCAPKLTPASPTLAKMEESAKIMEPGFHARAGLALQAMSAIQEFHAALRRLRMVWEWLSVAVLCDAMSNVKVATMQTHWLPIV